MAKTLNIQPLGRRVLVKPEEIEETTKGGLIVPDGASEDNKSATGTVLKLGSGKDSDGKDHAFEVKVGSQIVFKKYSPEEIEIDEEQYLLVDVDDILAVMGK